METSNRKQNIIMDNHPPNLNNQDEQEADKNRELSTVNKRSGAVPELLKKRLEYRKNARVYFIVCLIFNTLLIILSGFYFDCYYYTRKYITDGDYFWNYYSSHNLANKAVPLNAILTGMICLLSFVFNLMNLIVIGLYIIFGGVKDRIVFASKF